MEILVARLVEGRPDPDLVRRLSALVRAGGVRVLDFVVTSRTVHGSVSWSDVDAEEFSLAGIELIVPGILSEQDIREILTRVASGGWAVIAVEHTWSSPELRFRHPGASLHSVAHIPAALAQAALDVARQAKSREDEEATDDPP